MALFEEVFFFFSFVYPDEVSDPWRIVSPSVRLQSGVNMH